VVSAVNFSRTPTTDKKLKHKICIIFLTYGWKTPRPNKISGNNKAAKLFKIQTKAGIFCFAAAAACA
jgi:hypothetical protein